MPVRGILAIAAICAAAVLAGVRAGPAAPSAREVHASATLVDLHCDTLLDLHDGRRRLDERSPRGHVDLPRLREGGVGVQVFAVFVAPMPAPRARARAWDLIGTFQRAAAAHAGQMVHATTVADIERARREGKVAAVLAIENGDALGGDLETLDELYRRGVRMLGPTWNPSNALGDGVLGRQHGGLTDFGRAVLRRMERIGMVIDVSHLSETSFWDAMRAVGGPVIASHSNAAALHRHPRNLS